jgi:hypothetical protein
VEISIKSEYIKTNRISSQLIKFSKMMRQAISPKGLVKLQEEHEGEEITLRKPSIKRDSALDRPLIVDLGTYTTKIGFASSDISGSESLPSLMVPTLVGVTKLMPGKVSEASN